MAQNTKNAYFTGDVYLGTRDANGNPVNLQYVGLTDELKISFKEDVKQLKDASGALVNTVRLVPEGSISISTRDLNSDVLAKVLRGNKVIVPAAEDVDFEILGGVKAGQIIPTGHLRISNVVPTGVTADKYAVHADNGSFLFNADVTGDMSFKLDHDAYEAVGLLQNSASDNSLYFEGLNLANNQPVNLQLFKVRLSAAKEFSLLGTDFAKLPLEGDLLKDTAKPIDAQFGQYGSYKQL